MRTLTASDRESLIKLASFMPKGDETRKAILAGLKKISASNEPMARALERMNDALDRGGIDSMIKATAARLKATKDPSKALGIAMAIKQFLSQRTNMISFAQEKELLWIQNSAEGVGTLGGGVVATRKEVPGPGGRVVTDAYRYQHSILPAGFVDVATGANQYWDIDDTTAEVWKDGDNKLFAVVTYGHKPNMGIGSFCSFKHDQTGRPLRLGARMVGWFTLDPAGEFGGDIPKSGKLPVSTYK